MTVLSGNIFHELGLIFMQQTLMQLEIPCRNNQHYPLLNLHIFPSAEVSEAAKFRKIKIAVHTRCGMVMVNGFVLA